MPSLTIRSHLQALTLKEGDQQLGGLNGVLGHGRATDAVDGAVGTAQADIRLEMNHQCFIIMWINR